MKTHTEVTTLAPNCIMINKGMEYELFSYDSFIARATKAEILEVSDLWDYSQTTGKHLNLFLKELGHNVQANRTRAQKRTAWMEAGLING